MSTTQKAPSIIKSITDMRYVITIGGFNHGYCTALSCGNSDNVTTYYVYCHINGEEVLIGRDLAVAQAVALVNHANNASFNGEEI